METKEAIKKVLSYIPYHIRKNLFYGNEYKKWLNFLQKAQYWSKEEIDHWQFNQFKEMVKFAYENTEGYREFYKQNGVSPDDIQTISDIKHIPFTTKQLFQDNIEAFTVKNIDKNYITTGGSTGIPFGFYTTKQNWDIEAAFVHQAWTKRGWEDDGSTGAVLRGAFIGSEKEYWKYDSYRNELLLSSYYLTSDSVGRYVELLNQYKVKYIQSYPSAFSLFCDLVKENGLEHKVHFKVILFASENLYDWQITKFQNTFPNSNIFSFYGHTEHAIFADWCEYQQNYHLSPFYGYTEIVNEAGNEVQTGAEGELIGTGFHNLATPFIRYRTMDRAIKGNCNCPECKRNYHTLAGLTGRSQEVIVTKTGRYISMTAINMHDDIFDVLAQFQFMQEEAGKVIFKYIPKSLISEVHLANIHSGLIAKLGMDIELELMEVNDIPKTRLGKFRFLDQKLPINYNDNNDKI